MKLKKNHIMIIGSAITVLLLIFLVNSLGKNNSGTAKVDTQSQLAVNQPSVTTAAGALNTNATAQTTLAQDTVKAQTEAVVNDEVTTGINQLMKKYYDVTKKFDQNIILVSNQNDIKKTVDSISKKREGIEKYKSVKTYIKPGLTQDTYIVFTTYNIKLDNIDTLVPGMSVLSVKKDDQGSLRIDYSSSDDNLKNYATQLSKEDDIKKVIEDVNTKLTQAVKKDSSLKKFINYLKSDS
jgi:hypothetical protein